jgi:hypothetical protein
MPPRMKNSRESVRFFLFFYLLANKKREYGHVYNVPRIIADTKTLFFKKCSLWDLMLVMILSVVRMQMLVH